ncbi:MAG: site-2 protease family protein [Capsulimonadaceae bacterium]
MDVLFRVQQGLIFIIVLSVLVVAHEWGHFIVARLCKMRVDDFSIGFGNRLFRIAKLGDTEYNVRVLPLGGFVKIYGMEPDEEPINQVKAAVKERLAVGGDPDSHEIPLIAENTPGPMPVEADDPNGFNNKPLWQRTLVILAGPVMSILTGVIILCSIGWAFGIPKGKPINRVVVVEPGGEGHRIGLRAGDRIIAINGTSVVDGSRMIDVIHGSLGQTIVLTINRGGSVMILPPATPKPLVNPLTGKVAVFFAVTDPGAAAALGLQRGDELDGVDDNPVENQPQLLKMLSASVGKTVTLDVTREYDEKTLTGKLPAGIMSNPPSVYGHELGALNFQPDMTVVHMGFVDSCKNGLTVTRSIFETIAELIRLNRLQKSAGGIVRMANETGIAMKSGWGDVLNFAAQISISLGIVNLLPIPVLDGGHLLAFLIEGVRRKRMSAQAHQTFLLVGLAIICVLVVAVNLGDIIAAMHGQIEQ